MVTLLTKHYDTESYGLGCTFPLSPPPLPSVSHWLSRLMKLKKYVKLLGLESALLQGHTFETITGPITELREKYPSAGANAMHAYLWNSYDIHVSRYVALISWLFTLTWSNICRELIQQYLKQAEPELVAQRLANHMDCCTFYAAGVNHFWAMDQHDKWLQFGLHWHGCMNGFSGKILWLTVWWNNSNPKLICAQYLKVVKKVGGMCLIIISS